MNRAIFLALLFSAAHAVAQPAPPQQTPPPERKAPSGVKDDQLDGWSLADALRVDGQGWKPLLAQDPLLEELEGP